MLDESVQWLPPVWVGVDASYFYHENGVDFVVCKTWVDRVQFPFKLILFAQSWFQLDPLYKLGMPICEHLWLPPLDVGRTQAYQAQRKSLQPQIAALTLGYAPEAFTALGLRPRISRTPKTFHQFLEILALFCECNIPWDEAQYMKLLY